MGDGQRPIYADAKPIMAKQRAAALHTQRASLNMRAFLTGIFHPHSYGGDGNEAHSFPAALTRIMPRRANAAQTENAENTEAVRRARQALEEMRGKR